MKEHNASKRNGKKKITPKKNAAKQKKKRKKEYRSYLKSFEWNQIKEELFSVRGKVCEECTSTKRIEVHHLTYENIFNEEPEDLMILCRECHKKQHQDRNAK